MEVCLARFGHSGSPAASRRHAQAPFPLDTSPSPTVYHSLANPKGMGTPRTRFVVQPTTVRIMTPIMSIAISSGACQTPKPAISVVAPVGEREKQRSSRTAPVKASESATARANRQEGIFVPLFVIL